MNPLPVQQASQLESNGPQVRWLVQDLWTDQAVGILGGEPKCCKSFLALDLAVSVASAEIFRGQIIGHFPTPTRMPDYLKRKSSLKL